MIIDEVQNGITLGSLPLHCYSSPNFNFKAALSTGEHWAQERSTCSFSHIGSLLGVWANRGEWMKQLAFIDDDKLFDGEHIRFWGYAGNEKVVCAVTLYALQHCDQELPKHGLVSSDAFLASFDKLLTSIHHAARQKYSHDLVESEGPIKIMIHRSDLSP
jgi:hypothetical protein